MTFTPDTWIQAAIAAANRQAEDTGGDNGIFIVNVTGTYDETAGEESYTADKSFDEIYAAYQAGKIVFANVIPEASGYILGMSLDSASIEEEEGEIEFSKGEWNPDPPSVSFAKLSITFWIGDDGEREEEISLSANSYNFPTA